MIKKERNKERNTKNARIIEQIILDNKIIYFYDF